MNESTPIIGIKNIITYFTQKLFHKLYSQIHEATEAQIEDVLEDAWEAAFDEQPPVV